MKRLPIVVCHREDYLKLSMADWKIHLQSVDKLMNQTLEELVTEVAKLIESELRSGEPVYLFVGSFIKREGTFVRLLWRNNFHWEIVGKELKPDEVDALRPHWADGYEYGKGCVCDERDKI